MQPRSVLWAIAIALTPSGPCLAKAQDDASRLRQAAQVERAQQGSSTMGDFEPFRHEHLHRIHVEDSTGTKLASVSIVENFRREERYDDDPSIESGPASRRIVDVPAGFTVYGVPWGSSADEEPLPKGLDAVVKSLQEHGGVHQGKELVPFSDTRFPALCTEWIKAQTGYTVTFVADLR